MDLDRNELEELAQLVANEVKEIIQLPVGKWITIEQAMEYANVKSPRTIIKWIMEGHIYGFKRSNKGNWIIDRESIDDWYNRERYI